MTASGISYEEWARRLVGTIGIRRLGARRGPSPRQSMNDFLLQPRKNHGPILANVISSLGLGLHGSAYMTDFPTLGARHVGADSPPVRHTAPGQAEAPPWGVTPTHAMLPECHRSGSEDDGKQESGTWPIRFILSHSSGPHCYIFSSARVGDPESLFTASSVSDHPNVCEYVLGTA